MKETKKDNENMLLLMCSQKYNSVPPLFVCLHFEGIELNSRSNQWIEKSKQWMPDPLLLL